MALKPYEQSGKMQILWSQVEAGGRAEEELKDLLEMFFEDLRESRHDIQSPHMAGVEAERLFGIPHDVAKAMYVEKTGTSEWDD